MVWQPHPCFSRIAGAKLIMAFLLISFIAGVLTILAPCILPLLPVIVGRSISDTTLSKRRVFVVILSLGISVILFTLILKASTLFIDIPQDFWKYLSGGIIFIFGLITLFPDLWENIPFTSKINQESNKVLMTGYQKNNVWGDVIVGASLGPIFSACSPTYFVILATVLPVRPVVGMIYLFTYAIGLCLSLLAVSILGQRIMVKLNIASDPRGWFKRILGIIFILVSLGILTGYDKQLQISLLDAGFFDVTKVEQKFLNPLLVEEGAGGGDSLEDPLSNLPLGRGRGSQLPPRLSDTPPYQGGEEKFLNLAQKKNKFILAPDLSSIDGYINTDGQPITIGEFKNKKVVLLDIWTYSCINCQRTIPYLNDWHKKYQDKGLVIIGLHTPEFAFEHILKNVEKAVEQFGIKYPVVLDNDFSTWQAYKNQYWPRKYLIDIDGYIVYDHAGEGQYEETEKRIQETLKERNFRMGMDVSVPIEISNPVNKVEVLPGGVGSPEVYFGFARNEYLGNGESGISGEQKFLAPDSVKLNTLYLDGIWNFTSEYAENKNEGSVFFKYKAKNVYMVASSIKNMEVEVYLDDVLFKTINVKEEKLYSIVEGADYREHVLMLKIKNPGLNIFTFTFG